MDPLTAAREALERTAWTADEVHFRDHLRAAFAAYDELRIASVVHRQAVVDMCKVSKDKQARINELTAEVERLRLAGVSVTRGTECHITRGRDV